MDRCPTCGAAVRPGAKFCTSCGSRLGEHTPGQDSGSTWGQPSATDTQETRVDTPAVGEEQATEPVETTPQPNWSQAAGEAPEETGDTEPERAVEDETGVVEDSDWPTAETATESSEGTEAVPANEGTSWSSKWPGSETGTTASGTDSPASRFQAGLETGQTDSATDDDSATDPGTATGASTRSTWSWRSASKEEAVPESAETGMASDDAATPVDTSDVPGDAAVASTSGAATTVTGDDRDARERASALVDELRGLIWSIGVDVTSGAGHKNTIQNMSRVRGETGDFSDLASVIEAVRENPRDIDALRDLGDKAGRLQELLDSHAKLAGALDKAIRDSR